MSYNYERGKIRDHTSTGSVFRGTAAILTAIPVERSSVLKSLKNVRSESRLGHHFQIGDYSGNDFFWRIVLPPSNKGNIRTSAMAALTIQVYNPDIVVFSGTAGGIDADRVTLGDVVVADRVYHYGPRKEAKEGTRIRPWSMAASPDLVEIAKEEALKEEWRKLVRVSPIVSGELVLADMTRERSKELYDELRTHFEDAAAVEMEGMGTLEACELYEGTKGLVVRGISDLLYDESSHGPSWSKAAKNATAFTLKVLSRVRRNSELVYLHEEHTLPSESRVIMGENTMYELGIKIAKESKHLLVIAQRTPSLLFGPEPIEEIRKAKKHKWDRDFILTLNRCVERVKRKKDFRFVYLYSLERTRKRLKECGNEHRERVRKLGLKNLDYYYHIQEKTDQRFRINHIDDRASFPSGQAIKFSGPLAIGDDDVALWLAESGKGNQRKMLTPFLRSVRLSRDIYQGLVDMIAPSPASLEELQSAFSETHGSTRTLLRAY